MQALTELKEERKYTFHHLFDWNHVLESYKKRLKQTQNGKEILDVICFLLQEPKQELYEKNMKKLIKICEDSSIYEDFTQR